LIDKVRAQRGFPYMTETQHKEEESEE